MNNYRQRRLALNLTQLALAEKVGVSSGVISRLESDGTKHHASTLLAIDLTLEKLEQTKARA